MSGSIGIPIKYLSRMGTYRINNVHGISTVTVKTADSKPLIETHISTLSSYIKTKCYQVVGVDVKLTWGRCGYLLIIYADHTNCMVIHIKDSFSAPDSVCKFFKDPDICFVGYQNLFYSYNDVFFKGSSGVEVGELAARALKKPGLMESNLAEIAREVGVRYDGPSTGTGKDILAYSVVLTEDMMKTAINDACCHYQIGYKLLSSLPH